MLHPTGLAAFAGAYPDRVFDVGIAEQHAVTSAAGLAMGGLHPVVAIYATFLNRAFDQVLMDVALHRLPVTFVLDRAGVTGPDGASHNGMWDGSILQVVPGPADRRAAGRHPDRRAAGRGGGGQRRPDRAALPQGHRGRRGRGGRPQLGGMDVLARPAGGAAPDVLLVGAGPMAGVVPGRREPAGRPGHRRHRAGPALGQAGGPGAGRRRRAGTGWWSPSRTTASAGGFGDAVCRLLRDARRAHPGADVRPAAASSWTHGSRGRDARRAWAWSRSTWPGRSPRRWPGWTPELAHAAPGR